MPHKYQVASPLPTGVQGVEMPDRINYPAGSVIVLDDITANAVNPLMITNGLLVDLGVLPSLGLSVTTQGAAVTLTSTQVVPGTVTLVNLATAYNQLQVDVAALNTALSGAGKALV
jgi:hypothetical protein